MEGFRVCVALHDLPPSRRGEDSLLTLPCGVGVVAIADAPQPSTPFRTRTVLLPRHLDQILIVGRDGACLTPYPPPLEPHRCDLPSASRARRSARCLA